MSSTNHNKEDNNNKEAWFTLGQHNRQQQRLNGRPPHPTAAAVVTPNPTPVRNPFQALFNEDQENKRERKVNHVTALFDDKKSRNNFLCS